jgi:hypothetical protein
MTKMPKGGKLFNFPYTVNSTLRNGIRILLAIMKFMLHAMPVLSWSHCFLSQMQINTAQTNPEVQNANTKGQL